MYKIGKDKKTNLLCFHKYGRTTRYYSSLNKPGRERQTPFHLYEGT